MAESAAMHAYGAKVEVSDDNVTYTEIGEVADAQPPEYLVKEAAATHLKSDDAFTEAKPGMGETGKATFKINMRKAQYNTLLGYVRLVKFWRFSLPLDTGETTATRFVVKGFWSKLGAPKLDPNDANVMQVDVEITRSTAKPTYSAGA